MWSSEKKNVSYENVVASSEKFESFKYKIEYSTKIKFGWNSFG